MTRDEYLAIRDERTRLQGVLGDVVDAGKRAARLAMRASAVKKDLGFELRMLGEQVSDAGVSGSAALFDGTSGRELVGLLLKAQARETFAWADLGHDDRMAVLVEERERRTATIAWLDLPSPRPEFDAWYKEQRANADVVAGSHAA